MSATNVMTKILSGGALALIMGALTFTGTGVVNNDIRNTEQHINIRKEMVAGDKELREHVALVKDIVVDIRIEQKAISSFLKSKL